MGQEERLFDPRRDTENCNCNTFCPRRDAEGHGELQNCNTFCPRRATEGHGELQLQHLLSTKGHGGTRRTAELQHLLSTKSHGGTRRTATATPFVHEGPRRTTENCNCNTFCPRRATEGHGELQLQHLLSTKGRGGTGRTATATPFVHEGTRRTTENCNCNTFCPRRDAEGHGELQLHHLLSTKGHGGPRRTAELQHFLSTKSHGGTRRTATATPFVHEGPRRTTENCNCNTFCPRRDAEGHGELQLHHLLSTKGRGGTGRTATATPFVHEGTRRDGENGDCNTLCPRRDAGDHEENLFLSAVGCEEQLFDPRGAVKERARCLRS